MGSEASRGCGFRKVGGLYLVGDGLAASCLKLPANIEVCPCCGEGMRFFRGFRWINPNQLFNGDCVQGGETSQRPRYCSPRQCVFNQDKAGLQWVGARFYSPEDFIKEAHQMGVSKRIAAVPRGFELGVTWVLLAHKKAGRKRTWRRIENGEQVPLDPDWLRKDAEGNIEVATDEPCPAVFYAFRPTKIERVVTNSMLDALTPEQKERDEKQGITYAVVAEDDKDHRGTVYDEPEEQLDDEDQELQAELQSVHDQEVGH